MHGAPCARTPATVTQICASMYVCVMCARGSTARDVCVGARLYRDRGVSHAGCAPPARSSSAVGRDNSHAPIVSYLSAPPSGAPRTRVWSPRYSVMCATSTEQRDTAGAGGASGLRRWHRWHCTPCIGIGIGIRIRICIRVRIRIASHSPTNESTRTHRTDRRDRPLAGTHPNPQPFSC